MKIELRPIELSALRSIVLDYVLGAQSHNWPQEWIDVLTDERATLADVLTLITTACDQDPAGRRAIDRRRVM